MIYKVHNSSRQKNGQITRNYANGERVAVEQKKKDSQSRKTTTVMKQINSNKIV